MQRDHENPVDYDDSTLREERLRYDLVPRGVLRRKLADEVVRDQVVGRDVERTDDNGCSKGEHGKRPTNWCQRMNDLDAGSTCVPSEKM